jgi:aminoglycoside 3-N-acetyltransferase
MPPDEVTAHLRALGVREGAVLLVHTSFRAVRPVENGPLGLIEALRLAIGDRGTLVMPTMTADDVVFDPRSTPSEGMGITAELFWRQPGVLRSTHPGGSFAAAGPLAERICAPQPLSPPHGWCSPPGRVVEHRGQVLLLGVTHSESTVLHVAEDVARVPYWVEHPCLVVVDGVPTRILVRETDHCCRGFRKMDGWLTARGLLRVGKVGNAEARLVEAVDLLEVAVEHLREDPLVFLCATGGDCSGCSDCEECAQARASLAG